MKNLIGMTDFVLEQVQNAKHEEFHQVNETFVNKVINYTNFLKQPLELWMFVTCDKDGNVLEEPKYWNEKYSDKIPKEGFDLCTEFHEAKKRCLFEGLEIDAIKHHISQKRNVEYLANFRTLQLTPTAIKQLGL